MPFYRCGLGGMSSRTTLWTNSSPTSEFASQTIQTSQAISNFKYIEFEWRNRRTDDTRMKIIVEVSFFKTCIKEASTNSFGLGALPSSGATSASASRLRPVYYYGGSNHNNDDKSIFFGNSYISALTDVENNTAIPVYIYGLN